MIKPEEMKRLEADLASDKELNEKFYKAIDRIGGEGNVKSDGELFAKAASELGYNLTAADFERLDADREEIDLDELKTSAGGDHEVCMKDFACAAMYEVPKVDEYNHNAFCLAVWHCFTAMLHTETNSADASCWSDYKCMAFSKSN